MAAAEYNWPDTDLDEIELRLIKEYENISRPLDSLAYTEDFDRLAVAAGFENTPEAKHRAFITLLNLRKRGRLPRLLPAE